MKFTIRVMLFLALFGASFFVVSGVEARTCLFEDGNEYLGYCIQLTDGVSSGYCDQICNKNSVYSNCMSNLSSADCLGSKWSDLMSSNWKIELVRSMGGTSGGNIIGAAFTQLPPSTGEGCYCVIDEKTKEQGFIIGFSKTMAMKDSCVGKSLTNLPGGRLLGKCEWLTSPPSPVVSVSATTTASAEAEQKIGFNSAVLKEISGLNRLKATDLPRAIGLFVQWAMGMLGSVALVLLIYAGVLWMTAAGNAERTKKSQDIMIWAALGLIVIFSSYGIINFVLKNLS
jgi:hypothetical protein